MVKCEDCQFWKKQFYDKEYYTEDHGYCKISNKKDSHDFMDATCINEGINGELITRKDFGCILFKK